MDQNESTILMPMSNSRPISPSPVTESGTTVIEPTTAEEEIRPVDSPVKKKRGRCRKYDSCGKSIKSEEPSFSTRTKRLLVKRGDPLTRLGGGDLTPHIFTVNTGEDVIGRIMSFTQNGSRGICVLSANGAVCNVKIKPLGFNNNVMTFQGVNEILSLTGSMVISESRGVRNEVGGWRISIAGVNGCFFGGCLAGRLIAASPVQVVIGSFCPLLASSSVNRTHESNSLAVPPTMPNTWGFTSAGQFQQPELRDPSHLNQEDGTDENMNLPGTFFGI